MTNKIDDDGTDLDDDLTAEDVEAAIDQRAKERLRIASEQLRTGKVQAAYYNSYAYLRDLQEFALDTRDEQLKSSIADALNALDLYHQTLEQEYKWD